MSDDIMIQLIKEVESNLSNQIKSLGDKFDKRISILESSKKKRYTYIKTISMTLITAVIGAGVVYFQDHLSINYNPNVQVSK